MAVAVAQPTDVVKVRFQAQVRLPGAGGAQRYNGTFDAYRTIGREEGLRGLWKGPWSLLELLWFISLCQPQKYFICIII